jgi:hypothetical protein
MAMHRNTMANFFYLNEDTSPYEGAAARKIKPGHPIIDVRFFTAPPPTSHNEGRYLEASQGWWPGAAGGSSLVSHLGAKVS